MRKKNGSKRRAKLFVKWRILLRCVRLWCYKFANNSSSRRIQCKENAKTNFIFLSVKVTINSFNNSKCFVFHVIAGWKRSERRQWANGFTGKFPILFCSRNFTIVIGCNMNFEEKQTKRKKNKWECGIEMCVLCAVSCKTYNIPLTFGVCFDFLLILCKLYNIFAGSDRLSRWIGAIGTNWKTR